MTEFGSRNVSCVTRVKRSLVWLLLIQQASFVKRKTLAIILSILTLNIFDFFFVRTLSKL